MEFCGAWLARFHLSCEPLLSLLLPKGWLDSGKGGGGTDPTGSIVFEVGESIFDGPDPFLDF